MHVDQVDRAAVRQLLGDVVLELEKGEVPLHCPLVSDETAHLLEDTRDLGLFAEEMYQIHVVTHRNPLTLLTDVRCRTRNESGHDTIL